ncbi:MAG: porin [Oligoflexia bacterium]|nr:porin [Oligoflexia bacterium]
MNKINLVIFAITALLATSSSFAEDVPLESLSVGKGKAKLGVLLQTWMIDDTTILSSTGDSHLNYRLRRAELKLSGSVVENTRWFVMIDPAKSLRSGSVSTNNDNKVLQDLGVAFTLYPDLEIVAGQFKIPTTSEGLDSSSELLFPERAYVSRYFGDRRDIGMMLNGTFGPLQAKLMASNGQPNVNSNAANIDDTNNSKDLNTRLDYKISDAFKAGAFYGQSQAVVGSSTRYGGNLRFKWDELQLRAEGVQAKELDIDRNGMTTEVAYDVSDKFQPALRYENFQVTTDPNTSSSSAYTLGLNYLIHSHNAKIQLAGTVLKNMSSTSSTSTAGVNVSSGTYNPVAGRDGTLVILNAQMAL